MTGNILIYNASVVTTGAVGQGALFIGDGRILDVVYEEDEAYQAKLDAFRQEHPYVEEIDIEGKILMAGGIDAHVHFREPGMTHKADIGSESRAALLGGITSFIDMPNNNPPAITIGQIENKLAAAKGRSYANFGFHIGASNSNAAEISALSDSQKGEFAGVKVFMGSSTGNMLVDRSATLNELFSIKDKEILIHSEDEGIIRENLAKAKERFGDDIPFSEHENIRSRLACIKSTIKALELAMEKGTRLHVLHVSTAEEIEMIRAAKLHNPEITAETSANYLWFSDEDYDTMKGRVKCNPAIKTPDDRAALRKGIADGIIDTIGSDHAPHLLSEKETDYLKCPSGLPSIQQSFAVVMTVALEEGWPLERVTSIMSGKIADILGIKDRGKIEKGMMADLVVIDTSKQERVSADGKGSCGIAYKCGWSPYEGVSLKAKVTDVFLAGEHVVKEGVLAVAEALGQQISFQ